MGLVAAAITVTTNLTVALTTGIVGRAGAQAIAGYGIGSRLEYLLIPLAFSLGAPLVAIVGTCIGAGDYARARRAAWLGAAMAGHGGGIGRPHRRRVSGRLDDLL